MAMAGGLLRTGLLDQSIALTRPAACLSSALSSNSLSVSSSHFSSVSSYGDGLSSGSGRGFPSLARSAQGQSGGEACCRSGASRSRLRRAARSGVCVSCLSGEQPATVSVSNGTAVAELPCLPFTPAEVFVPSSTKVLHLYEARFLSLLEEVVGKYDNLFAHIVIEPMSPRGADDESKGVASFLATYGCLARVEKVKRLEIGAEVTIRGIGRVKLLGLTQLEPFLKGTVISLKDEAPQDTQELGTALEELRSSLSTMQQLQIKLKVSKQELLQTPLERALQWADKVDSDEVAGPYLPSREERVSFAALQPVAGSSAAEQQKLLQERLSAMEAMDTLQRVNRVKPFVQQTVATLAAKVTLQALNL